MMNEGREIDRIWIEHGTKMVPPRWVKVEKMKVIDYEATTKISSTRYIIEQGP